MTPGTPFTLTRTGYAVCYLATAVVFLALDAVWLLNTGEVLYRRQLGDLFLPEFKLAPAAAFYVVYVAGILIFATSHAAQTGRWSTALARGGMLGFLAYATYDLTNQATLRNWSTLITVADLCWGTTVTALAAAGGLRITRWVMPVQSPTSQPSPRARGL